MAINNELNARIKLAIDNKDVSGGTTYPAADSVPLEGEMVLHVNSDEEFDTFKIGKGDKEYQNLDSYLLVKDNGSSSQFLKGDGSWNTISNSNVPSALTGKTYNNINLVNNSSPSAQKSITITGNVTEETWVLVLSNNTTINRKMLISQ